MLDARWIAVAVSVTAALMLASTYPGTPASRLGASRSPLPDMSVLEAKVGRDPSDADALAQLSHVYLAHGAPGLAEAALARAPELVRHRPDLAHARALALADLGRVFDALASERDALASCSAGACSRTLAGRAFSGERWLAELVRAGVDDPRAEPERALFAYRRASREVTLQPETSSAEARD